MGWWMAKNEKGLYGKRIQNKIRNWRAKREKDEKFNPDINSLLSVVIGFFGITALLGATGFLGETIRKIQEILVNFQGVEFFSQLGMTFFCFVAFFFVFRDDKDPMSDQRWGYALAILFPLGGGIWSSTSEWTGNILVMAMGGVY